ncbi:3-ketosteroid reductase [Aspergillus campestris IBT 28561]|uniref:3-ketosteroid reductase n=1 Tax=Aspergillus campestris (strain IBT 28561) TaxID=1392248 RepID=A0A2I1CYW6_ASPC2|nr:3-ketosteroid reductase [Aspergillus campestris IBT 28561]PKY02806.1 3-ketosteroid reductase [Aspergillus campestris IBT 28561]
MEPAGAQKDLSDQVFILVTGANSGLGFSICCRLADEFLSSPANAQKSLTVVFTTRSTKKGTDTLRRLQDHLRANPAPRKDQVTFLPENVDLSNLLSVRALSRRLNSTLPKLDSIILNAGVGGWTGIDWPRAIWGVCTDLVHEVSWPSYKVAPAGMVTESQIPQGEKDGVVEGEVEEPRLGSVFCANVFGHYMLAHNVMPLLRASNDDTSTFSGRIIWVSSLEASKKHFNIDDLQGLRTTAPYESSKALTDILALTADLPSTSPWVNSFYSTTTPTPNPTPSTKEPQTPKPTTHLSHPGICGTSILPLSPPLFYSMLIAFWLARMLGSPWHNKTPYMGACAPVFLALAAQSVLDDSEAPYRAHGGSRVKWGSSCSRAGVNAAVSTEVDGWGHGGVVGKPVVEEDRLRRRKRGDADLGSEEKEEFVELGRRCWREMEVLRGVWEGVLDRVEGGRV